MFTPKFSLLIVKIQDQENPISAKIEYILSIRFVKAQYDMNFEVFYLFISFARPKEMNQRKRRPRVFSDPPSARFLSQMSSDAARVKDARQHVFLFRLMKISLRKSRPLPDSPPQLGRGRGWGFW